MSIAAKPMRSWLFTPGTRPDRFAKAAEVGADVLIIDLEDAVAPHDKASARDAALAYLVDQGPILRALRINGLDTGAGIADVDAFLQSDAAPDFILLPKTESAGHLHILDRLLAAAGRETRLIGLIESALGLASVEAIAGSTPRLSALMLGAADMAADLGAATAWAPLAQARARIVHACALSGVLPIDSPFFDIHDAAGLTGEVSNAVAFGFPAKGAIHPGQVDAINKALTPSKAAVDHAHQVLAANEKGVARRGGADDRPGRRPQGPASPGRGRTVGRPQARPTTA